MDRSNVGQYASSVYSDEDTQYGRASSEYSSVTGHHYTSISSPHYVSSSIAAPSGQNASSTQYFPGQPDATTTSTRYGTTSTAANSGYTTLTSQELRRHDAQLHSDRQHAQSGHRSHRRRPHGASSTANAALPRQQLQEQVTHSNPGMASSQHPQVNTPHYHATSAQPHYTPSSSITHSSASTPYNNENYSHTQYTPPSSINSIGYNQPQDTTYWTSYIPSPSQGKDLAEWGYDLAGVGTQFSQQSYASYNNNEEE